MDDDASIDEEMLTGPARSRPAYDVLGQDSFHPQCSGKSGAFCFLCAFEPQREEGSNSEHPASLRSFIRALISQNQEIGTIVSKVQEAYNASVRDTVVWVSPNNKTIKRPEWSLESIQRHLVHSSVR
jgi:hypothetical protein